MSFDLLSDDLVLDIFDLIWALPYNIVSLGNLAVCSKRLNDLAAPLLYKEFNIKTWSEGALVLRTLLRRPKLGEFCRSLTSDENDHDNARSYSLSRRDRSRHRKRIVVFCNTPYEVQKWAYDLRYGKWDALTSLLLSCMPNVERIQINHYDRFPFNSFDRVLERAAALQSLPNVGGIRIHQYKRSSFNSFDRVLEHAAVLQSQGSNSPFALSRLRSIQGFKVPVSIQRLVPLLRLKSLQIAEFDEIYDDVGLRPTEMPSLELETLVLRNVDTEPEGSRLNDFLSNFKTLKCFRINERNFYHYLYNDSNSHTLDEALSGLKHCLEELEVWQRWSAPDELPWINSLADFKKLCKVSLGACSLFNSRHKLRQRNTNVLPASLETLELILYDQYAIDQLLEILQRRQELVPQLVQIRLRKRVVDRKDKILLARFEEAVVDLKKKCDDASIALQFSEA